MARRVPAVFPLADLSMDAAWLCDRLQECLPLVPGKVRVQPVYYLDTAADELSASGSVLLAKPQAAYWALIHEQLRSGRPMGGIRAGRMPERVRNVRAGVLREQLSSLGDDHTLEVKAELTLSRQSLVTPGEAPRLLLESAASDGRLIGRRVLLVRQPVTDALENKLFDRLSALTGELPVSGHSWYRQMRPELGAA